MDSNLYIVGYEYSYSYNAYYVARKDMTVDWPGSSTTPGTENKFIAKSIQYFIGDNEDNDMKYEVTDTSKIVDMPKMVDGLVVIGVDGKPVMEKTAIALKYVKIYSQFKCLSKKDPMNPSTTYTHAKLFYPTCRATNSLCSGISGAYVPAITVCNQQLF
jgi:hypothetical protein